MNQKPTSQVTEKSNLQYILSDSVPPRPHLKDQAKKHRMLLRKLSK